MNQIFLCDDEVMFVLRITRKTLLRNLSNGPTKDGDVDLRKACPVRIGCGKKNSPRRWPVGKFAEAIGMTREDIWELLK